MTQLWVNEINCVPFYLSNHKAIIVSYDLNGITLTKGYDIALAKLQKLTEDNVVRHWQPNLHSNCQLVCVKNNI